MRRLRLIGKGGAGIQTRAAWFQTKGGGEGQISLQGRGKCLETIWKGGKKFPKSLEELKVSGGGDRSSEMTQLNLQVRRETRGRGFLVCFGLLKTSCVIPVN